MVMKAKWDIMLGLWSAVSSCFPKAKLLTHLLRRLAIFILLYPSLHSPTLESAVGPRRPQTCHPYRVIRPLNVDVLLWIVEDVLGPGPQVRRSVNITKIPVLKLPITVVL